MRLDRYIANLHPEISRHLVKRLISNEQVLVNAHPAEPDYQVKDDDQIRIIEIPTASLDVVPEDIPLHIVFENNDFLIIDKPAGMVVHPGAGHPSGTLANALITHLSDPKLERAGIVHRLDKDTSGLLIVAKNEAVRVELLRQFKNREVSKEYLGLIKGDIGEIAGEINYPIGRDPKNRLKFKADPHGKDSLTRFFTEQSLKGYTLLRLVPVTGRTHQLRVHLAHLGHPMVGDLMYGGQKSERLFLHATKLTFKLNNKEWAFTSNLPKDLKRILDQFG